LDQQPSQDLIARWRAGDEQALKDLLPLVYEQLRGVAREHLRKQRANHTLQTTALIHEAYLRFAGAEGIRVQDRNHFIALASRMMRQVSMPLARSYCTRKRGKTVCQSRLSNSGIFTNMACRAVRIPQAPRCNRIYPKRGLGTRKARMPANPTR
jgi:RNA polymerase sigma factor (TIGR02999 family)